MLRTYIVNNFHSYILIFFFFFLNTIFPQYSAIFLGAHSLNEENVRAVERSCEVLNAYLNDREYVAGDTLTIADFAIHTTICVLLVSISTRYVIIYYILFYPPCTSLLCNYNITLSMCNYKQRR